MASLLLLVKAIMTCRQETNDNLMATKEDRERYVDDMNDRHLKMFKAIQGKSIEALRSMPITTAMQAVRAIDMAVRNERLIREQPTERSQVSVEQILRDEWNKWMLKPGEVEDWSNLGEGGAAAAVNQN